MTVAEMLAARATAVDKAKALADLDVLTPEQALEYDKLHLEAKQIGEQIERKKSTEALMAAAAVPTGTTAKKVNATAKSDPYEKDQSLILGGLIKMCALSRGDVDKAFGLAERTYGEGHPVTLAMGETKALNAASGTGGAFTIPPDFMDYIIPLLYARTVVRRAGAQTMPMPNGTMTIPKMTSGSQAFWIAEGSQPTQTQPGFGQVVATAHKLAALVPVTNDILRYATAQFDASIRNDLVTQISLAEDAAFIRGMGTAYSPKGLKNFALPGETLTSTFAYTLTTVNNELAGLVNKLESANLPLANVGWLMAPRTKNYLYSVQNSLGLYVYRDEMKDGKLMGYPFYTTTQIPTNLTINSNANCSEIYLVDFGECLILEGRQMEFAISTEGVYTDSSGATQSAFANDMTIIRALLAEDFQMKHNEGVAFDQGVAWSPAIS